MSRRRYGPWHQDGANLDHVAHLRRKALEDEQASSSRMRKKDRHHHQRKDEE